jgi:hypothetical protein
VIGGCLAAGQSMVGAREGAGMAESSERGRPTSWIAVSVMIVAFTVGGLALILNSPWLFIASVVVFVLGGVFGLATGIMSDTH